MYKLCPTKVPWTIYLISSALIVSLLSPGAQSKSTSSRPAFAPDLVSAPEAEALCSAPAIEAYWEGPYQWLFGQDVGLETFNGGIATACAFCPSVFAQCINTNLTLGDYVPVEIRFSADTVTMCAVMNQRAGGYPPDTSNVGVFPGAAWDMSDPNSPRRLNICFNNWLGDDLNPQWDPGYELSNFRRYVYIMASDYDGTGLTYTGKSPFDDTMDIMYGGDFYRVHPDTVLQVLPASLHIVPIPIRGPRASIDSGSALLTWGYTRDDADRFRIYGGQDSLNLGLLDSVPATTQQYEATGLINNEEYFFRVEAADTDGQTLALSKLVSAVPQKTSSYIDLVGTWNERNSYGDVWGYVDPATGKEYALLCSRSSGVSIIDLDTTPLTEIGFIPSIDPGRDAKDVKTYGHYAIVVKEREALQIVDISDVTAPVEVSRIQPAGPYGAHNCLVDGHYLYVVGNHDVGGTEIFDILDPANPVKVGEFQPYYYHDLDVRNDTMIAPAIYGDGIDIVDVSDKANPVLISHFNYPGSGAHNVEISADGRYIFVGDEIGSNGNHTRVFNISNPLNVYLAAEIIVDPDVWVHNCYLKDDILYISHYDLGLRAWDVSDHNQPSEIGYYNITAAGGGLLQGYGCWGVYPYLPSGRILGSDMDHGLWVVKGQVPPFCCTKILGDANDDGAVTSSDILLLVNYVFKGGAPPADGTGDVNCDGDITSADAIYLVAFVFKGGPEPFCP